MKKKSVMILISLNRIRILKSALQSLKNNEIEIERIFDLEKFATQFAIIDLMYGLSCSCC